MRGYPQADPPTLQFIWRWLPAHRKNEAQRLVRVTREDGDYWLSSRDLTTKELVELHAIAKACSIHAACMAAKSK